MARPAKNLRLFVAIHPPPECAAAMLDALAPLLLPEHRRTSTEQVHLTLQFIGDTPVREMDRVRESVLRATGGLCSFDLTPERLIRLPERGPARLIAAETDAPSALLELQRRLAHRLAQGARRRPGDRFLPHMTLCRFRSPAQLDLSEIPLQIARFAVDRITLMRSTLTHEGARHEEIASYKLNHE